MARRQKAKGEMMRYIEINLDSQISYKDMHQSYGRAEFEFCPVIKNGKITDLFIVPRQQEREEKGWHLDLSKLRCSCINFVSWIQYHENPNIWNEYWCKIHKALTHRIYVPKNTQIIEFDYHFGDSLSVRFVDSIHKSVRECKK